MNGFIVLFGSSLTSDTPRDMDVVVGGDYSMVDAEKAARRWWSARHASPPPPVELHRQNEKYRDGHHAHLLRPCGAAADTYRHTVLAGVVKVEAVEVDSLPAALRLANDGQPQAAARMIDNLRRQSFNGRTPLSLAAYDEGRPVGIGGYIGDGPVALEQALQRTGDTPIEQLLPSLDTALAEILSAIRAAGDAWSGRRWQTKTKGRPCMPAEPGILAGLRKHWQQGSPLGCRGYVGPADVFFEYAPNLSTGLVREIVGLFVPRTKS